MPTHVNVLTREIMSSAIEVHRKLGPGLRRLIRNAWPGNSYYEEYPAALTFNSESLGA